MCGERIGGRLVTTIVPFRRDACFGAACSNDRCPIHGDPAAMTNTERMAALACTFPTILFWDGDQPAPGAWPFEPSRLDAWASSGRGSHAALYAARFLLAVWSGRTQRIVSGPRKGKDAELRWSVETPWRCGPFDVVDALATWDQHHRTSFLRWAARPWWP